jgi:eukaryotic-like serine/threonine-protein kinase
VILCPRCGGENSENARFCRHCGSPISAEMYSTTRLPLGTILDERYKIIDYVAKGGMGAIYKALDLSQKGVFWAVKEMLDYFDTEEEREYAVERFAMEAQILYDLNHECIPKFVDCFVSENRYYLVMEFIEGSDLRKMLENGIKSGLSTLKEEDILSWAIQICDVLNYLHTQNPPIVYRDMKPGNMMVNPQNKIYLIDFGIARLFDPRVKGTMVGTQGYAPPEQYKGEAEPRSDLYSTAACMHHLLTGKDPRNDIPFNFPPVRTIRADLSKETEWILNKALSLELRDRQRDMTEMRDELRVVLNKITGRDENQILPGFADSGLLRPVSSLSTMQEVSKLSSVSIKESEDKAASLYTEEERMVSDASSNLSFWYMFRSDRRHSGKSPFGRNIQGKFLWCFNANSEIRSSPALSNDGTIYFGANNGKLYAVTPDGDLKWSFQTAGKIVSSPSINRDGSIYAGSNDTYLYAVDPEGHLLWRFKTYGRLRSSPCPGPDGTIYIGSYDHYFYAIKRDGTLKWRVNLAGYLEATPAIADDGSIYIASLGAFDSESILYKIDNRGNVEWYYEIPTAIKSSPCISRDGHIFVAGMDGGLYSFDAHGNLRWNFQAEGPIISCPLTDSGSSIIICSQDRNIYSIDPKGKLLWKYQAYSSIDSSPAMSANGSVFVGGDDSFIYAISQTGQLLWRIKCGDKIRSSPAIGENDVLYVGSDDGFLYAIE